MKKGLSRQLAGCHPWVLGLLLACVLASPAAADDTPVKITGIDGELATNVRSHLQAAWMFGASLATERRRQQYLDKSRVQAAIALRPWGYYSPEIEASLEQHGDDGTWRLSLHIDPGPPVRIRDVAVSVLGPGADDKGLRQWQSEWPLRQGTRLDQKRWEEYKQAALDLAAASGYLGARFSRHRIALDLEQNQADLELELETGPRAVMGVIDFQQEVVMPHVLVPIARFEAGDPYRAELVELLRLDLWKAGYFSDIEVIEQRRLDQDPPVVDFLVRAERRTRDTHQGTLGYGTDTLIRAQYNWTRHILSNRGDTFAVGAGWRQRDSEWRVSADYLLPRRVSTQQYWVVNGLLRRENENLAVQDDDGVDIGVLARGQVSNVQLKLGRLRLRSNQWSRKRIAETVFVDLLDESDSLQRDVVTPLGAAGDRLTKSVLGQSTQTVSFGMQWDWPVIRGAAFATTGHHERAWWFVSSEAWGSDKDFAQVYLSSRWNHLLSDRWKVLLRAEAGYSRADSRDISVPLEGGETILSVTELPFRYRFKAGGSHSVRGYGFNSLSNNGVGSNHLLAASAELEYRVLEDWSLAGFYDFGNAFNDWNERSLKRGWGLGVRWYAIFGSVRLDFGRAEDIEGNPREVYLTIGTQLL
jgi:translocation and assembly module TamA